MLPQFVLLPEQVQAHIVKFTLEHEGQFLADLLEILIEHDDFIPQMEDALANTRFDIVVLLKTLYRASYELNDRLDVDVVPDESSERS